MHKKAATDPGKELHLYSRIGMYNEAVLSFFNQGGSDYDLSAVTLEIGVKRNRGEDDFVILTEGDGITVTGNDVSFVFTEAQSATFTQRCYYWELRRTIDGNKKVWLNGDHDWHNGRFDSFTSGENITIDDNGVPIDITINDFVNGSDTINANTQTSTPTLTPSPTYDAFNITAQAEALTIANPSTDYANFEMFVIRIKDNGTARALTFGSKYRAQGEALPTTTTISKVMIIAFMRDSLGDKYDTKFSEEV